MAETSKKVDLNVKLKIKDVLRYNMHIAYKSWFSKLLLVVGIGMCGWLAYRFATTTQRLDIFFSENVIFIMLAVFILIGTPMKVWRITATQMQSPIFSGTSRYSFSREGIHIGIQDMEDTVGWETYIFIKETSQDFRFFVDRVQAQIIPKHNMTTEQVGDLRTLIKEANPKEVYSIKKV